MLCVRPGSRVLAIGAHPDDIEIGAGGFLCRLVKKFTAQVTFLILTDGIQAPGHGVQYPSGQRKSEAEAAAKRLCGQNATVVVERFHDCTLEKNGHETIKAIESHLYGKGNRPKFDIVLTHSGADTHADHRATHEATLSAARNFHGTVLLYQAPSTKPNGFQPTLFVNIDSATINRKHDALQMHVSQKEKPFMTASRTHGLAGSWPIFLRLGDGAYLEAFEIYKCFI